MSTPQTPDRAICSFEHPVFAKLGDFMFCASDTAREPVIVLPMGKNSASLSLLSFQHELAIAQESPDSRMFELVAKALDFVQEVRPGDALPMEVQCGEASWEPDLLHQRTALARITMQLTTLLGDETKPDAVAASAAWAAAEGHAALAAASAPEMDARMKRATIVLANKLGLPDPASATQMLKMLTDELSFIEALRARLLHRVAHAYAKLGILHRQVKNNAAGIELVNRVSRLIGVGRDKIRARFAILEGQSADLVAMLADFETGQTVIRGQRDWLYASLRAWEDVLIAWDRASTTWSSETWPLLNQSYRFLAPRFMPLQEWRIARDTMPNIEESRTTMVW